MRARLDRTRSADGDTAGARLLARDLRTPLPLHKSRTFSGYIGARTRFFDDQVVRAGQADELQVVILGAGYDDRSLRYRRKGIRFVEVDHPATQRDKLERFRRLGIAAQDITFLPVDLSNDDLATSLAQALRSSVPTLLLCEGLIPYLPTPTVESLLHQAASCPGTRRHLALELPVRPTTARGRIAVRMLGLATASTGEPIRTVFHTPEIAEEALVKAGWRIETWQRGEQIGMPTITHDLAYVVAVT